MKFFNKYVLVVLFCLASVNASSLDSYMNITFFSGTYNTTHINDSINTSRQLTTVSSPSVATPRGFTLNGAGQYLLGANLTNLTHSKDNSGSLWFTITNDSNTVLVGHATSTSDRFAIEYHASNQRVSVAFYNGSDFLYNNSNAITASQCNLITWNYTASTKHMDVWSNGVIGTGGTSTPNTSSTAGLYLGRVQSGNNQLSGSIHAFSIGNESTTTTEINSKLAEGCSGIGNTATITINETQVKREVPSTMYGWKDLTFSVSNHSYIDIDGNGNVNSGSDVARSSSYAQNQTIYSGVKFVIFDANYEWFRYTNQTVSTNRSDINPSNATYMAEAIGWYDRQGISVVITNAFMTQWLANNTATCGDHGVDVGKHKDCSPNSWTNYTLMVKSFFSELTCDTTLNCYIEIPTNEPYSPGSTNFYHGNGTCADRISNAKNDIGNYTSIIRNNLTYIQGIFFSSGSFVSGGSCAYNYTTAILDDIASRSLYNVNTDYISFHEYASTGDAFVSRSTNASTEILSRISNARMVNTEGEVNSASITGTTLTNGNDTVHFSYLTQLYSYMINNTNFYGLFAYSATLDTNLSVAISNGDVDYNYVCWHDPQLSNANESCFNALHNVSTYHRVGTSVGNWTSNTNNVFAIYTTDEAGTNNITVGNKDSLTTYNLTLTLNNIIPTRYLTRADGTVFNSYGNTTVNIGNIAPYEIMQFSSTPYNISINSTSPSTPLTINEPDSQDFQINITNDGNMSVLYQWYVNGTENITYFGTNNFTWDREYDGSGVWNITVVATSLTNSVEYTWILTVTELNSTASILLVGNQSGTLRYANWSADLFDNGSYVMTSTATGNYTTQNFGSNPGSYVDASADSSFETIATFSINGTFVRTTHTGISYQADLKVGFQNQATDSREVRAIVNYYNNTNETLSTCSVGASSYGTCAWNMSVAPVKEVYIQYRKTGSGVGSFALCSSNSANYKCSYNYYKPGFLNFSSSTLLRNHTYTVIVNDTSFASTTTDITTNADAEYTHGIINLYNTNTILLEFYNETTDLNLSTNTNLQIIGSLFSSNYTNATTVFNVSFLIPDDYELVYWIDPLIVRRYFVTVNSQSIQNIRLYTIDDTTSEFYIAKITDVYGRACSGASVSMMRYFVTNNSYKIVEMSKSDTQGNAVFSAQPNVVPYKFIINGTCGYFITEPSKLISSSDTYAVSDSQSVMTEINGVIGMSKAFSFNNETDTFVFTWDGSSYNVGAQGCLEIKQFQTASYTTIDTQCESSTASSLIYTVTDTNETKYIATATLYNEDGTVIYSDTIDKDYTSDYNNFGLTGVFLTIIVFICFIFMFGGSTESTVFAGIFAIFLMGSFNFIYNTWVGFIGIVIVGVIIAYKART